MPAQTFRVLPALLLSHRVRRGLAQKAMAVASGLDQSTFCAIERGRRSVLRMDVVERLSVALGLETEERAQLRWAVEHDRLLTELMRGPAGSAAPLVSAALNASRRLTAEERSGVVRYITDLVEAREKLERAAAGGRAREPAEEPTMT
jgi:transcriptional regulator with XRE-family HTH domain